MSLLLHGPAEREILGCHSGDYEHSGMCRRKTHKLCRGPIIRTDEGTVILEAKGSSETSLQF